MRLLVLGGTQFLGRHVVEVALERGREVTLFNRGQTRPELFPDVEKLRGDRAGDLAALRGRSFDAVVDTSGFVPRIVAATLDALGDVGHYTFVSTMSVYPLELRRKAGEDASVAVLDEETEEVRFDTYGPLKALCEDVVRSRAGNAFVPRPGLIVGPWDPTGRFTYWPQRFLEPGPVLAPAPAAAAVQIIDARDLAAWILDAGERGVVGTYNAISKPLRLRQVLETCRRVAGSDAEIVYPQIMRAPVVRAHAAGLQVRPLERTVRDTLDWLGSGGGSSDGDAGLAREKERHLLAEWAVARGSR